MPNIYKTDVSELTLASMKGLKEFCSKEGMKYTKGKLADSVDPKATKSLLIDVEFFDGERRAFWNYYG